MPGLATLHSVVRVSFVSLRLATLMVIAMLAAGCPDDENGAGNTPGSDAVIDAAAKKPGKHAGKKPGDIRYDNDRSGLERLMRDLRTAINADDEPEIAVLLASLRMQNDDAWLKATFGEKLGAKLSADYKPHKEEIGVLAQHLAEQFKKGLTEIQVDRFQTPGVQTSTGYQSAALKQMDAEAVAPLYSVRFVSEDDKRSFHLWSFVHREGSFRYIGKLRGVAKKNALDGRDLNEYRLSDAERLVVQEQ